MDIAKEQFDTIFEEKSYQIESLYFILTRAFA